MNCLPPGNITAEVFNDKAKKGNRYQPPRGVAERAQKMTELAQLVVLSLQGEYIPAAEDLPEDKLREALIKEADNKLQTALQYPGATSLTSAKTLQEAEAALASTTRSLDALLSGGVTEDDPIAASLLLRQQQQRTAVEKLKKGAPTRAAQKEAPGSREAEASRTTNPAAGRPGERQAGGTEALSGPHGDPRPAHGPHRRTRIDDGRRRPAA